MIDKNKMTVEQLSQLRNEIKLGSIFMNDYENSFGIDRNDCFLFFDGYMDYLMELVEESYKSSEFWTVIDKYDNIDTLYDWYCMLEFPFN